MSKSKRSKKWLNLSLLAGGLVLFWFALIPYREARASELVDQAEALHTSNLSRAIALLREANFIHADPSRIFEQAQWEFESGDVNSADKTLAKSKRTDANLQHNIWLEEGKIAWSGPTPNGAAGVVLAQQLAQQHLPRTAEKLLSKNTALNSTGTALLAQLRLDLGLNLPGARDALKTAIAADPSDLKLHELLQTVSQKLGDQKTASDEAAKINLLKSGRP